MNDHTLRAVLPCAAFVAAWLAAAPLAAQQPDTLVVTVDSIPVTQTDVDFPELDEPTTPRGAMLRAVLLPGWGHASIGSYQRGAFYFAAETTVGFMLARTMWRIGVAKDARGLEELRLTEALAASGVTNADSLAARLDADQTVDDARELVDARRQQLEDWIALATFLVFLSGADAFVSAHLRDFPEPLEPAALLVPGPTGLTAQLGISVAVGWRPRR